MTGWILLWENYKMLSLTHEQKKDFSKQRQTIITPWQQGEIIVSSIDWEDWEHPHEIYGRQHSSFDSMSEYINDKMSIWLEYGKKYMVCVVDEDEYHDKLFSRELI